MVVTGGDIGDFNIPLTLQNSSGGDDYYTATQVVDVYADPGSSITLNLTSTGGTFGSEGLTVAGYLV